MFVLIINITNLFSSFLRLFTQTLHVRMSSSHKYSVTLLAEGSILADLHYGLFSRNWWVQRTLQIDGKLQNLTIPYPLYMSVICTLNGQQFFISIVKNDKAPSAPGFICFSNGKKNQNEES